VTLPGWIAAVLRGGALAVAALFAVVAVFAAVVMPYRLWDSLAFGSWSRQIAEGGGLWFDAPAPYLQRPLFYLEQGLAWRLVDDGEWIGRLLSLSYSVVLVVAVWLLARRLTDAADARAVVPPVALLIVLASSVVATYAAAGMTDVPVAAMVAATGAAVWAERPGPARLALVGLLAAGAVLAKPTALIALAGLTAALVLLHGRRSLRGLAAVTAGIGVALAYAAYQAARVDDAFADFLTAGNDEFWRERGAAARWDAIGRAEWFGAGPRLVVLYGIAYAIARVAGARPRVALGAAAGVAIGWSILGPLVADGEAPYPFDGSLPGIAAWLLLVAGMAAAPFAAAADPISRRTYAALLVWLAPMAGVWAAQRADEVRHLAPAWAPLVLIGAAALGALTLALARLRPAAALAPATAVALVALANVPSVDGLGREGWRDLLELGPSGWTDRAERENFAYGPFSYELDAAREHVGPNDTIVSSNGRLTYFFPGRVEIAYPTSCGALDGARFYSYLTSGESAEFAALAGQRTDALGWLQCARPPLSLVSEQEGIYAAFVVGDPPARTPAPDECRIAASGGQDVDAIFGDGLTYAEASALRNRAFGIGYTGGLVLERTGCSTFRVVVTGLPAGDEVLQESFRRDAAAQGFDVTYAPGTRFPEVPPDVTAVP
jgi:4-amino-4-deoxy-L-arabinose transferase-like glycosyltransferase